MDRYRRTSILFFVGALGLLIATYYLPHTFPNLPDAKQKVMMYVQSGQYNKDLVQKSKEGLMYLKKSKGVKAPAIVFDIDETLLSNYTHMRYNSFGGNATWYRKIDLEADATPINPMRTLFNEAKARHITIFLITGRPEDEAKATYANLKQAGFSGWDSITFWPAHSSHNVQDFKSSTRESIEKKGYTILLTVGDQWSDLKGGYCQHMLKLPNPFYTILATHHRKHLAIAKA